MIDGTTLHDWISQYINDPVVKRQVDLIDINNDKLFGREGGLQEPNFELDFP